MHQTVKIIAAERETKQDRAQHEGPVAEEFTDRGLGGVNSFSMCRVDTLRCRTNAQISKKM